MKKIKIKNNRSIRKIVIGIVISIFIIYTSLVLSSINRNYFLLEKVFKEINLFINKITIKDNYNYNKFSSNVINSKIKYLEEENKNLKDILDIKSTNSNYIASKVINRLSNAWYNTITINSGYKNNIKVNDVVFNDKGLIGFISKISKNVSEVTLLTKKNNNISVLIETKEGSISGVLNSYDKNNNLFRVTDVISKNKINRDDKVVLSGYNNDSYKGIYVGKVVNVLNNNYGLSKTLIVKSDVEFNNINYVIIKTEGKIND